MFARNSYAQPFLSTAMSHRFEVTVGSRNLGAWSKMSGLSVKFDLAEHRIGSSDQYFKYAVLPKFEQLKFSRAADDQSTPEVRDWLNSVHQTGGTPEEGSVTVLTSLGTPVMTWDLHEMFPFQWNVSDFDASTGKVLVETLVIVYSGFLDSTGGKDGGKGTVR